MFNDPIGNQNRYRPLQNWQSLRVLRHDLSSNYNSLQASLAKQSGRINYTLAYTFGKAMGIINNDLNPFDRDAAHGPLAFNRTHVLSATYVVHLPNATGAGGHPLLKAAANGWILSGLVTAYSGANLQANSNNANFNLNAPSPIAGSNIGGAFIFGTPAIRAMPRLTCDPREGLQENQYLNPSCFAPPIAGVGGGPGVNGPFVMPLIEGPGFWQADLSLFKEFAITESKRVQFRAQAYNFLNHPLRTFLGGDPNLSANFNAAGALTNPRFGFADNKVGRRTMMFALKFYF
jgi:hypothetical protein